MINYMSFFSKLRYDAIDISSINLEPSSKLYRNSFNVHKIKKKVFYSLYHFEKSLTLVNLILKIVSRFIDEI